MEEFLKTSHADLETTDRKAFEFLSNLEEKEGFEAMIATLSQIQEKDITHEHLERCILQCGGIGTEAGLDIAEKLNHLRDPSLQEQANKELEILMQYIAKRAEVFRNTAKSLTELRPDRSKTITSKLWEGSGAGKVTNSLITGFKQASGKEKALMLAGATAVTVMALMHKKTRKLVGTVLGGGLILVAADTAITTVQRGRFPSDREWKMANKENHLNDVVHELREGDVKLPEKFLDEIREGDKQYVYPIVNLSTLFAEQFGTLYTRYAVQRQIPDNAADYPHCPFTVEDEKIAGISPSDRFLVMEDMAIALGFLDKRGGAFLVPPEKKVATVLSLALHWEE
jgi:hypothetical protein